MDQDRRSGNERQLARDLRNRRSNSRPHRGRLTKRRIRAFVRSQVESIDYKLKEQLGKKDQDEIVAEKADNTKIEAKKVRAEVKDESKSYGSEEQDEIVDLEKMQTPENGLQVNDQCCGICLQAFEEGEQLKVLDCNNENASEQKHIFHAECITQWFCKKAECPLCRKNFEDEVRAMDEVEEEKEEGKDEDDDDEQEEEDHQEIEAQRAQLRNLIHAVQNMQRSLNNIRGVGLVSSPEGRLRMLESLERGSNDERRPGASRSLRQHADQELSASRARRAGRRRAARDNRAELDSSEDVMPNAPGALVNQMDQRQWR